MSTPPNTNPVGNPIIRSGDGTSTSGDFDRFQDLAAKLVQVSKSELDEKRAQTA